MEFIQYIRTDLAMESFPSSDHDIEGITYQEQTIKKNQIIRIEIKNEIGAKALGKPIGKYTTLHFGKIWLQGESELEQATAILAQEILQFLPPSEETSVLIVGLGNQYITPDAVGPWSLKHIIVTRHIKTLQKDLYDALGSYEISAIAPGVLGQTGMETVECVRGAVEAVHPSCVIVIDALASRSTDRLATTIQLSDTGLCPGSGIGNQRKEINSSTLGVPVLAIGVPTVVDSSTLVYDALEKAGIEEISDTLKEVLDNGKSFFVSLKESDTIITEISRLLGEAINVAFTKKA